MKILSITKTDLLKNKNLATKINVVKGPVKEYNPDLKKNTSMQKRAPTAIPRVDIILNHLKNDRLPRIDEAGEWAKKSLTASLLRRLNSCPAQLRVQAA
jgi:hypothetical protein